MIPKGLASLLLSCFSRCPALLHCFCDSLLRLGWAQFKKGICPVWDALLSRLSLIVYQQSRHFVLRNLDKRLFPYVQQALGWVGNCKQTLGHHFALGISETGHTNIKKLKFQQYPNISTTLLEESALIYYQIRTSAHQNDRKDRGIILWFR